MQKISNKKKLKKPNATKLNANKKLQRLLLYSFAYECILNSKREPVIIIIGGHDNETNVSLFNISTQEFIVKKDVCFEICVK